VKLLLTGSDGFVGSILRAERACVPLADENGSVDLRAPERLQRAVSRIAPEAVVHLAAQSSVPASFADPRETYELNFFGTLNLLEALKASGFAGRLLYVGSGDAYGAVDPGELPVDEAHALRPRNPYAVSKAAAEILCYQWSRCESFQIVMTRSFNHIGPGQSERFAISDFARQIVAIRRGAKPPVIRAGDIDGTRDFTDVRDIVRAYILLLERGRAGEIYNVCSGIERPVRALLLRLLELAGVEAAIERDPSRLRSVEQQRSCGNPAKLRRDTGWAPAISLDTSLADILADWETRLS